MGDLMSYERLAQQIMFGSRQTLNLNDYSLQYRKGKSVDDVKKARGKSIKRGNFKTEQELDWLVLYLKDVFKVIRKKKPRID